MYPFIAITAAKLLQPNKNLGPKEAWKKAIEIYNKEYERSLQDNKGCPRNTFLGLCNLGLLKGVNEGDYGPKSDNMEYARVGVRLLAIGNQYQRHGDLWTDILKELRIESKAPNSQAEIVLALFNNDYLTI